jgi:hypothetical protein
MRNSFVFAICMVFGIASMSSCTHDSTDISGFQPVCFSEILSIYSTCTRCHNGGELDFTGYDGIKQGITPKDPLNSEYYSIVIREWSIMPPDKPLTLEQRTKIRIWIQQGAENKTCP